MMPLWTMTGSWAVPDGPISCTNDWSKDGVIKDGEVCTQHKQPYEHPGQLAGGAEFSIAGSHNAFSNGKLTISAGQAAGWDQAEFTGAEVLTATVHKAGQETGQLEGTFDPATQIFTVDDPDETRHGCDSGVMGGHDAWRTATDDVNVHFEMVSYGPPPAPPPQQPPTPAPRPSPTPASPSPPLPPAQPSRRRRPR